jgi:hypothetical protein
MAEPSLDLAGLGSEHKDRFYRRRSDQSVNAGDVIDEVLNHNTSVHRVYGDGVHFAPLQTSSPAVLVPGQYWFETSGPDTILYVVNSSGIKVQISGGGGGGVNQFNNLLDVNISSLTLTNGVNTLDTIALSALVYYKWEVVITGANTAKYTIEAVKTSSTSAEWVHTGFGKLFNFAVTLNGINVVLSITDGVSGDTAKIRRMPGL